METENMLPILVRQDFGERDMIKENCIKFQTVDPEGHAPFFTITKVSRTSFSTSFRVQFFKKNIDHLIIY